MVRCTVGHHRFLRHQSTFNRLLLPTDRTLRLMLTSTLASQYLVGVSLPSLMGVSLLFPMGVSLLFLMGVSPLFPLDVFHLPPMDVFHLSPMGVFLPPPLGVFHLFPLDEYLPFPPVVYRPILVAHHLVVHLHICKPAIKLSYKEDIPLIISLIDCRLTSPGYFIITWIYYYYYYIIEFYSILNSK